MHEGIESHGGPVTALAFALGGDDLVSTGLDGRIHHWDLRPDSCFVESVAAIGVGNKRSSSLEREEGGGGMDPCVATGGRLMPTCFTTTGGTKKMVAGSSSSKLSSQKRPLSSRRSKKASLAIIQPGSRSTTTLLSTSNTGSSSKGEIVGYSLFGRRGKEPGGHPDFVLNGHLADVTCLVPIVGMWDNLRVGGTCGNNDDADSTTVNHVNFLTGGRDGMVLSWGNSRLRSGRVSNGMNGLAGWHTSNAGSYQGQFSGRNSSNRCDPRSTRDEEPSFEDIDNW